MKYKIYNKSSFGLDIDGVHISPRTSKEFNKISDMSAIKNLEFRELIVLSTIENKNDIVEDVKSNTKKPSKKSNKDTINYINDEKEFDSSEVIENKTIKENLGDEE